MRNMFVSFFPRVYRALLGICRALLGIFRALLGMCRGSFDGT